MPNKLDEMSGLYRRLGIYMAFEPRNAAQLVRETEYCYAERLKGHSYREIANSYQELYGERISHQTVKNRIDNHLETVVIPNVEQVRKQSLDRLDLLASKLNINDGDPATINAAIKIEESRRKLLGVDVPVRQELSVVAVDATDTFVGELLTRQQSRNTEIEQRLRELEASDE